MIKYNDNTINDWFYTSDNIIKVYRNNTVCYYKVITSGDTSGQTPCFAVVDNISQYQETEFEDVFNKADGKWYKLNNLDEYEQYGVYGSGRNITYYDGKLTIDDGYEYIYSGSSWENVGEVSGSSRVPQGYTEVEYIQNTGTSYINTNFLVNQDTRIVTEMQTVTSTSYGRFVGAGAYNRTNAVQFDYETGANGTLHVSWGAVANWSTYSNCTGDYNRHTYDWDKNYFYRDKGESNQFSASTTYAAFQCTDKLAVFCNILNSRAENYMLGKMYSFQLYDNGALVRDLVPCTRDSDSKAGAYDVVNDVFYVSPNNANFVAGSATTQVEYPLYYDEIADPPNNVSFSSMIEAEAYECPWVGMTADIDNTDYIFDVNYLWVTKYDLVEVSGAYICDKGNKYKKMEEKIRNVDDTWSSQIPPVYEKGELIESASTDCPTYTQYEYIRTQNAATIYYDFVTNFKPTTANTLEVKVEFVDRSIDWGHLVSWKDGSSNHTFNFQTVTSSYQAIVRTGGNNGISYRPTIGANNPTVYTLPLSAQSGTYSTNGGVSQTIQYNYSTMTLPADIGMCFFGQGTTSRGKAAVAKMYYVKVYDENGNLVKHYVPSDNNGAPCFYEIVDGEYIMDTYTGSNHGTLTLGPEV